MTDAAQSERFAAQARRCAELRVHLESVRPWIDLMAFELVSEIEADLRAASDQEQQQGA